jgi:hypothetical protein
MGFGPSAGWAQALTDLIARDANLPPEKRLYPGEVSPESLPVWGSIIDDVWALDHVDDGGEPPVGPVWLDRASDAWVKRGVQPHEKKSVNAAAGEEIQGYYVHPEDHWIGVSMEKRRHLYQATFKFNLTYLDAYLSYLDALELEKKADRHTHTLHVMVAVCHIICPSLCPAQESNTSPHVVPFRVLLSCQQTPSKVCISII